MKKNCWEMKNCGRQPGGPQEGHLGVCVAATDVSHAGANGGSKAGRYCWKVAGTLCGGVVQGSSAAKRGTCVTCEVLLQIKSEEGLAFVA